MSREWNVTGHLLYHLSFTSELIGLQEEAMLKDACGLTHADWRVMSLIESFTPVTSRDITRVSTLSKVMVSRVIARLTKADLIERTVALTDNRMQHLRLTKAGRQVFRRAQASFERWSDSLLSPLDATEVKLLKRTLDKLRTQLAGMNGATGAEMRVFGQSLHVAKRRPSGKR